MYKVVELRAYCQSTICENAISAPFQPASGHTGCVVLPHSCANHSLHRLAGRQGALLAKLVCPSLLNRCHTDAWTGLCLLDAKINVLGWGAVLPRSLYPDWATGTMDWYLSTYGDPLCKHTPPWFRALVWSELLVQLPFFCYGAYAFAVGDPRVQKPVRRCLLSPLSQ